MSEKLKKIYESLQLEKLDEAKQEEIKTYIQESIDLKAKEMAEEKVEAEKEKLVEQFEEKFETYKEDITSKFSNFVDEILEQEMQIPEKIKKYAKIGERYEPIMEQLRVMMGIDEGSFDEEAKGLLKESAEEIERLEDKLNKTISEKLEIETDAQEMAAHIYLRKKCDGLTEAKREKIMKLLEDVKSKEEIDRKFKIIVEDFNLEVNEKTMYCKDCGAEVDVDDDESTCPECSGNLTDKKPEKKDDDKGKGKEEVDEKDKKTKVDESDIKNIWLKMIRENSY